LGDEESDGVPEVYIMSHSRYANGPPDELFSTFDATSDPTSTVMYEASGGRVDEGYLLATKLLGLLSPLFTWSQESAILIPQLAPFFSLANRALQISISGSLLSHSVYAY